MHKESSDGIRFGLAYETVVQICEVFADHPEVESVILYGSRAKGNHKHGSDIDLTLIGQDIDIKQLNRLSEDLDDLMLPYSFDISVMAHISNQDLVDHIERVGKVVYRRPE